MALTAVAVAALLLAANRATIPAAIAADLPTRTANESTARLHANLLMSSRFAEASI